MRNASHYNPIQFNSTTNYSLKSRIDTSLKLFQQKLIIITFMKGGFTACVTPFLLHLHFLTHQWTIK